MSKSDLSEREICTKYIAPAVNRAVVLVVDGPTAQP
jgi:hypothetical protein